jgi:hypothetical protein
METPCRVVLVNGMPIHVPTETARAIKEALESGKASIEIRGRMGTGEAERYIDLVLAHVVAIVRTEQAS